MQSVGLIQREIEKQGMPTISITLNREITEKVKPPRALLLAFPLGHPIGNAFDEKLQTRVLLEAFKRLETIEKPNTIIDLTDIYFRKGKVCKACELEES